jgi:hypothetical protein
MSILNKHIVNSVGRGQDKNRETWHALRRTTQGALWYQKRDKNVGTFSNDGGTTELVNDEDYVAVVERYIVADEQNFTGTGSQTAFTLARSYGAGMGDRLAVFVNGIRQNVTIDYTVSSTTLTFVTAPISSAVVTVKRIKKEYKNDSNDTFQQYRFEIGDAYYRLDSNGKLKKIENKRAALTAVSDNFSTFESLYPVNSTTYNYLG